MDHAATIIQMLVGVLVQLLELFVTFMIAALRLVLQFAQGIATTIGQ